MALFINTNVASLGAQRSLATSGAELKTAMERLSSGKKINSAADDAAGFAIAERMTAQIRGLNMATKNANDGLSMLGVIENATNDVTDMLHRMRELAIQATNDTNGTEDRAFLQKEVAELIKEIDRVATQTQYNGQTVLDGSFTSKSIQVGTESGQKITFSVNGIKKDAIGTAEVLATTADVSAGALTAAGVAATAVTDVMVAESDVGNINISTAAGAQAGLQVITDAIEQVAGDRATYRSEERRVGKECRSRWSPYH